MPPIPVIHTLPPLRYLLSRAAHISSRAHPLPVTPVAFPIPVTSSPSTSILVASPPSHIPSPSHRLPFCRLLPSFPAPPFLPCSLHPVVPYYLPRSLQLHQMCLAHTLLSPHPHPTLTPPSPHPHPTLTLPSPHPHPPSPHPRLLFPFPFPSFFLLDPFTSPSLLSSLLFVPLTGVAYLSLVQSLPLCFLSTSHLSTRSAFPLCTPHPHSGTLVYPASVGMGWSAVTTAFPFPSPFHPLPLPPLPSPSPPLPPLPFPPLPLPSPLPSPHASPLSPSPSSPPVRLPSVPQPLGLVAVLPPPEGVPMSLWQCCAGQQPSVPYLNPPPSAPPLAPPLHPPCSHPIAPPPIRLPSVPQPLRLAAILPRPEGLPPAAVRLCLNPQPHSATRPWASFENSKKPSYKRLPLLPYPEGPPLLPYPEGHPRAPTSLPVSNTRCLPSLQPPPPQYYTLLCLNLPVADVSLAFPVSNISASPFSPLPLHPPSALLFLTLRDVHASLAVAVQCRSATTTAFPLSPKQTTQPPLRFPPSQYYVPLCLNLSGLVLFFLTLRGVHVSVAVPVSNGATFAFNAAAAYAFGEKIQLYYVPLCLNLSGLVLFFLTLRGVHVSVAVPVSNGATFGFNAAAGYAFGEKYSQY
ncbi:unnamed protein product [Closterium sp. NIES-64]|nr:unnamed protein product [Closterium sp. NIES-64]